MEISRRMSIHYSVIAVHDIFFAMDLAANLTAIRQRIAEACARPARQPESVTLLAVTKSQPPEVVAEAAQLRLSLSSDTKAQRTATRGNPRSDDRAPMERGSRESAPGIPSTARVERTMRANSWRSPLPFEHGHDRRF